MKSFLSMELWKSAVGTVEKLWDLSRIFRESSSLPVEADSFRRILRHARRAGLRLARRDRGILSRGDDRWTVGTRQEAGGGTGPTARRAPNKSNKNFNKY
jgi:hypothetical protein